MHEMHKFHGLLHIREPIKGIARYYAYAKWDPHVLVLSGGVRIRTFRDALWWTLIDPISGSGSDSDSD